jgi:hypothetical protein
MRASPTPCGAGQKSAAPHSPCPPQKSDPCPLPVQNKFNAISINGSHCSPKNPNGRSGMQWNVADCYAVECSRLAYETVSAVLFHFKKWLLSPSLYLLPTSKRAPLRPWGAGALRFRLPRVWTEHGKLNSRCFTRSWKWRRRRQHTPAAPQVLAP